jgi:regulator of protease activity HflC (stomatin/prohibitin superfamily)
VNLIVKIAAGSVAALVALTLLFGSWFITPPGYVSVVTVTGNLKDEVYGEGLHFKMPFLSTAYDCSIQQLTHTVTDIDAGTFDQQQVKATVAINFTPDQTEVHNVFRNTRCDVEKMTSRYLNPHAEDAFKYATAQYTAEDLLKKRQEVAAKFLANLKERLKPYSLSVAGSSITNFAFSAAFNQAIEQKVMTEQKALAARNDLDRVKFVNEAALNTAKTQAESIRIQAEAIKSQGGAEYVQLKWIEKWNGALPTTQMGSGAVPMVNIGK